MSSRRPDQGEGEPASRGGGQDGGGAGGGHHGALQHHLMRHAGRDPALPPAPRAGLPGADAALPDTADGLLPQDHRHVGGSPAQV